MDITAPRYLKYCSPTIITFPIFGGRSNFGRGQPIHRLSNESSLTGDDVCAGVVNPNKPSYHTIEAWLRRNEHGARGIPPPRVIAKRSGVAPVGTRSASSESRDQTQYLDTSPYSCITDRPFPRLLGPSGFPSSHDRSQHCTVT